MDAKHLEQIVRQIQNEQTNIVPGVPFWEQPAVLVPLAGLVLLIAQSLVRDGLSLVHDFTTNIIPERFKASLRERAARIAKRELENATLTQVNVILEGQRKRVEELEKWKDGSAERERKRKRYIRRLVTAVKDVTNKYEERDRQFEESKMTIIKLTEEKVAAETLAESEKKRADAAEAALKELQEEYIALQSQVAGFGAKLAIAMSNNGDLKSIPQQDMPEE